jgi:hypothetical protein
MHSKALEVYFFFSSKASLARKSSFTDAASASNCLSHSYLESSSKAGCTLDEEVIRLLI